MLEVKCGLMWKDHGVGTVGYHMVFEAVRFSSRHEKLGALRGARKRETMMNKIQYGRS